VPRKRSASEIIRQHYKRLGIEGGRAERRRLLTERGPLPEREPSIWLPLPGMPRPWLAMGQYVLRDGRPVIRELRIIPGPEFEGETAYDIPPEGVTSTHLRRIHTKVPLYQEELDEIFREAGVPVAPRALAAPRRHGQRVTDDEVAAFAVDYLTAVRKADKRPRAWLREEYGRRGQWVTDGQIRDRIRQATDRGFLTEADGPGDRRPRRETEQLREWRESKTARRRRKK